MPTRDLPGVIAPPPLIYLGILFIGWSLTRIGGWPEVIDAGFGWLAADFGLDLAVRRGVALTLIIVGLLFDGMAAGLFRRRGTAVEPWKPSTVLVIEGPYRISRNPIYLANGLLLLGLGGLFDNAWFFVAAPVAAFATDRLAIRREERHLAALFGAAWSVYVGRVRRWLGRRMTS